MSGSRRPSQRPPNAPKRSGVIAEDAAAAPALVGEDGIGEELVAQIGGQIVDVEDAVAREIVREQSTQLVPGEPDNRAGCRSAPGCTSRAGGAHHDRREAERRHAQAPAARPRPVAPQAAKASQRPLKRRAVRVPVAAASASPTRKQPHAPRKANAASAAASTQTHPRSWAVNQTVPAGARIELHGTEGHRQGEQGAARRVERGEADPVGGGQGCRAERNAERANHDGVEDIADAEAEERDEGRDRERREGGPVEVEVAASTRSGRGCRAGRSADRVARAGRHRQAS